MPAGTTSRSVLFGQPSAVTASWYRGAPGVPTASSARSPDIPELPWIAFACCSGIIRAPHFSQGGWGDAAQAAIFFETGSQRTCAQELCREFTSYL